MPKPYVTRALSRLSVSDLRTFVGDAFSRKLAHNTWVEQWSDGDLVVRFHATGILTFHQDGSFVVNTGGYHTTTTKQRLNALLPAGYRIHQQAYRWYISTPQGTFPFVDGQRWNEPTLPNLFGDFEDVHYGDVQSGDYVWDRSVSRWVRVTAVVERNSVEVELHLWGGAALVAELDTLIARKTPASHTQNGRWCECPDCSEVA